MGYIVALFYLILNLSGMFIKNLSKIIGVLSIIILWVLFGWNNNNPDYYIYERWYNEISFYSGFLLEGKDLGYKFLMNITSLFNIDYQGFVIIFSLTGLLLIHSTIRRFAANPHYVYLLYFIYPFLLDIVQVRNFLMMSIIIYSIKHLVEGSNKSKLKFLMLFLIAFSIHSSAILYFPLVFINNDRKNNLIAIMPIFIMLFSLIVFLNGNQIPFVQSMISFITGNEYIASWFEKNTDTGFLLFWAMQLITLLMIYISKKIAFKNEGNLSTKELRFINLIFWISIIELIWLPLYMISIEFTRLMRNLFILNYIVFSITNKSLKSRSIKKFSLKGGYNLLIIIYTLTFFIIQIFVPHFEDVVISIFENNLLWK